MHRRHCVQAVGGFLLAFAVCGFSAAAEDAIFPVNATRCEAMKIHHVLHPGAPIGCARLKVVQFDYIGFDQTLHRDGELVVLDAVAARTLKVFVTLRAQNFPIAKATPVEAYEGDDAASMADDNTSAFNARPVTGGTKPSLHAYGAAIDLNPVENPFLQQREGGVAVSPSAGVAFVNRRLHRPGKPDRKGFAETVIDIFAANGFTGWGGNWDSPIDYQHFQIDRALAEELASLPPVAAQARFEATIAK